MLKNGDYPIIILAYIRNCLENNFLWTKQQIQASISMGQIDLQKPIEWFTFNKTLIGIPLIKIGNSEEKIYIKNDKSKETRIHWDVICLNLRLIGSRLLMARTHRQMTLKSTLRCSEIFVSEFKFKVRCASICVLWQLCPGQQSTCTISIEFKAHTECARFEQRFLTPLSN